MSEARAFSWLGFALSGGIANAVINAPLGWLLVRSGATLSLWGVPGIAADLVAMAFGISFGTGLAVTLQTRAQVRKGQLRAPELAPWAIKLIDTWPAALLHRAINLGVISVPLFVPLPLLALVASGVHAADQSAMVLLKGTFAFVQGALVTPMIAAGSFFPRLPPSPPI